MSKKSSSKTNFLAQGTILVIASFVAKAIGMIYRIPLTHILGDDGNGYYSTANEIYTIILMISSFSLPLAVSRLVAEREYAGEVKNSYKVLICSLRFAAVTGGILSILTFLLGGVITKYVMGVELASYALRVLAPAIFLFALTGVLRGFFQGHGTMVPTAVSQIIEQIINAIVSVAASYLFMKWNADSLQQAAWGAAGGTLGTCLGAASALLLVMFVYWLYRPVQAKLEKKDVTGNLESYQSLFKILILTILPIVLSQTVYNISGLIDYKLFGFISAKRGLDAVSIKSFIGVYSSKYRLLCSVPIAISTAIASSMIPSAVAAYTEGDDEQWNYNVASGIKFNMIIAIPCALGLTVLGQPVVRMLFSSSNYVLGGHMMTVGATAIIFYALSNVTGGALQSIDKMRIPVIHSAISLVIHIGIVSFFLACTNIGVYALLIGNITFPILVFILNLRAIKRYVPSYRQEVIKTFFAPLAAGFWMALAAVSVYGLVGFVIGSNLIRTMFAVCVAVVVYFTAFLLLKGLTKEELFDFPMGRRLYLLARKMHLMK